MRKIQEDLHQGGNNSQSLHMLFSLAKEDIKK